jgi:serine/threonine protein kinase
MVACGGSDTLGALVAGALPEAERAAIADHAAVCADCHALIDGLVGTRASCPTAPATAGGGEAAWYALGRGAQVGRYLLDAPLGIGGMSVVHAAVDPALGRRIAVKLSRPELRDPDGGRDRLIREARSLARLAHPNVVTLFDVGEHRGQPFLALELVDGGSLSAWLRRAARTTDEILDCLIGAARGLAACHAAGIVHRDIKPDNILVGLDGRARISDFGLARSGERLATPAGSCGDPVATPSDRSRPGTLAGTPAYMAPEHQARGETDPRSDQWSFCATLYEALAGVRPFVAEDLAARAAAIAAGRLAAPAPGRRVPGWLHRLVARGLHADPAARWPSMDAVVDGLAHPASRRVLLATPPHGHARRQARRGCRRTAVRRPAR